MIDFLVKRIPQKSEQVAMLSVAVFYVFSWSIRGFLFKLPSFTLYLSTGEIFAIFFYMMAFAFIESLVIMVGLNLLSVILPGNWLKTGFSHKGFLILTVGAVSLLISRQVLRIDLNLLLTGALIMVLLVILHNVKTMQNVILFVVDRLQIFVYLYIPLGLLSVVIVFLRNIL